MISIEEEGELGTLRNDVGDYSGFYSRNEMLV